MDWEKSLLCPPPAEVMAAISPAPSHIVSDGGNVLVFFSQSSFRVSLDQTKVPASSPWWFISESHFHPPVHSPWLLLFSHCELLFSSLGVADALLWLLWVEIPSPAAAFLQFIGSCFWPLVFHFSCWTFSVFCPDVFLGRPVRFPFTTFPFCLCWLQMLDPADWEHPTSFATLWVELSSWMSFGIFSIVSPDGSLFSVMFPVHQQQLLLLCKNSLLSEHSFSQGILSFFLYFKKVGANYKAISWTFLELCLTKQMFCVINMFRTSITFVVTALETVIALGRDGLLFCSSL